MSCLNGIDENQKQIQEMVMEIGWLLLKGFWLHLEERGESAGVNGWLTEAEVLLRMIKKQYR